MEYQFSKSRDFLNFQDFFYYYLKDRNNPFYDFLFQKDEFTKKHTLALIGKAHYRVFLSTCFADATFAPLAQKEKRICREIFIEMNVAIIRHEIETHRNPYSWKTRIEVEKHQPLFPCSFSHNGQCSVNLPKHYQNQLERIVDYLDALTSFDTKGIAEFIDSHFKGVKKNELESFLKLLSLYYETPSHIQETLALIRATKGESK